MMFSNHQLSSLAWLVLLFQVSAACAADTPAKKPVPKAPPVAAAVPTGLPSDPAFPIQPDIAKLIANSPFFKLPEGNYAPLERYSPDVFHNGSGLYWERQVSIIRVQGSPLCRQSRKELGVNEYRETPPIKDPTQVGDYLQWAGLIPLSSHTSTFDKNTIPKGFVAPQYQKITTQLLRLDKLTGQPFPLTPGNTFSWEATLEEVTTMNDANNQPVVDKSTSALKTTCKVGATGPASALQAGLQGTETAVVCTTLDDDGESSAQTLHWLDSAGCFVNDYTIKH